MSESAPTLALPRAYPGVRPHSVIRSENSDFKVSEILSFDLSGEGEHRFFKVRKCGHNSLWAARALASATGTRSRDVGFAGHKDRHGVTTQWFSVRTASDAPLEGLPAGIEVVAEMRHRKKLRRGALRGNRFDITLRDVSGDQDALRDKLAQVANHGFPNYFGEQRFGRDGANLARARDWFCGGRPPRGRSDRSFAISAARSHLFNRALAWRIDRADWSELQPGDIAQLAGTRSIFGVDQVDETLRQRAASGDVNPTGPLWGHGVPETGGQILELELRLRKEEPELTEGLSSAGLKQERRALRVIPAGVSGVLTGEVFALQFELPRGSFATALLREIIDYKDAAAKHPRRRHGPEEE